MSYVKNPVFEAFRALLFDLARSKQLSPEASPDLETVRILPVGYQADYSRGRATPFPVSNASFPFRARMSAGARDLFDTLFLAVLSANATPAGSFGWQSEDWLLTINGQRTSLKNHQMLFAISVCRSWAILGNALEISLQPLLSPYIGSQVPQLLPKKALNTAGPDAFFPSGGRLIGLPYDPFSVEAKAGDGALGIATKGVRLIAAPGKIPGKTSRERYGNYVREAVAKRYALSTPSQFATLLMGVSYTQGPQLTGKLPKDVQDFFDAVLVLNAWGHPILRGRL